MPITDNFDLLTNWIRQHKIFTDDLVLFLQIIRRRKENPDAKVAQQTVKNFYLKNADDLVERRADIIRWCEAHNARAYLRLNLRSKKKIALQTLKIIAENISNDNYHIKNCYESAAGQYHSDPQKTWIVDLDHVDFPDQTKATITSVIHQLVTDVHGSCDILTVPTKNGVHLITRPFNKQEFTKILGFAAPVHPDNPTLLYCP